LFSVILINKLMLKKLLKPNSFVASHINNVSVFSAVLVFYTALDIITVQNMPH